MRDLEPTESGSWRHPDDPGEPSTGDPRLSVTELEAAVLGALCADRSVVEIGTGLGVSTRAIAEWASSVVTVDVDPWVQETIWPALPSLVVTSPLLPVGQVFDVCFIDGDHSTEQTAADIEWALDNARLVLVHDVRYPNVAAAMGHGWVMIPTEHGIGVIRPGRR